MEKRVDIKQDENQNVEQLFLTYSSYMSMLQYFAESGLEKSSIYDKKWNEAVELWIKLDKAKRVVEKKYKPAGDWDSYEFDFDNCQVVFTKNV